MDKHGFTEIDIDANKLDLHQVVNMFRSSYRNVPLAVVAIPGILSVFGPKTWFTSSHDIWEYAKKYGSFSTLIERHSILTEKCLVSLLAELVKRSMSIEELVLTSFDDALNLYIPDANDKEYRYSTLRLIEKLDDLLGNLFMNKLLTKISECNTIDEAIDATPYNVIMVYNHGLFNTPKDIDDEDSGIEAIPVISLEFRYDTQDFEYCDIGVISRFDMINMVNTFIDECKARVNNTTLGD